MKRYKVALKNAKECRVELAFADLCVKYTNGFSPILKVKEGEEIPLSVCDPEDVRKSWIVGSLKGYFDNGWIVELKEDEPIIPESGLVSQFITEQMAMAPKQVQPVVPEKAKIVEVKPPSQPILPEATKDIETPKVFTPVVKPITDLSLIKSYEDFNRLSHFEKLRWIKESNNIELLKDIAGKTPSAQFKNNINLRLTQLKS